MEAAIIATYRCNFKCVMCNIWKYPTSEQEEFSPRILEKLPKLSFCNITGGEPYIREDIEDIIKIVKKKAKRVVISTNGYFTEKIIDVAKRNKDVGVRISIEGLPAANDELRGMKDGFDHALRTLLRLNKLGFRDIGFGITISDRNAKDMLELYQLAKMMNLEFATAVVHNSYYFHKHDNKITKKAEMIEYFNKLIYELLEAKRPKNWFRAYFNYGLINYIKGNKRLLPCRAGYNMFFLDPWGEVRPCNGMECDTLENSMGNLKEKSFNEIWNSEKAKRIRGKVMNCPRNCWMIGTASPSMKANILKPTSWVIKHKFLHFTIKT